MANHLHRDDLPADVTFTGSLAVDTETMGLHIFRDRLCVVQISDGNGDAHLVHLGPNPSAPNLIALLSDPAREKIFHFARFDLVMLRRYLGITCTPVFCTRTASRLVRTNTERHGLRDLCKELLGVEISKQQQSSDWAAETLTDEQVAYAASDVLHLHKLRDIMDQMLVREGRRELAQACFDFLPHRAELDLAGFENEDLFAH